MASTAPAQTNAQQGGNRGNKQQQQQQHEGNQGGEYSNKNGNPAFKKNYRARAGQDGSSYNNQQESQGGRRGGRRDQRDDTHNEVNGSPRNEEYRGKGRRNNKDNANGSPNINGNHKSEAHTEQSKTPARDNTQVPSHLDGAAVQLLINDLQERYPNIPVEKIQQVIKKHGYNSDLSVKELNSISRSDQTPWIAIVKGKAAKPDTPATPADVAPVANGVNGAPHDINEHTGKDHKKRGKDQNQQNHPQQNAAQHHAPQHQGQGQGQGQSQRRPHQPHQPHQQAQQHQNQQHYQQSYYQQIQPHEQVLQPQLINVQQAYQQPIVPEALVPNEDILNGLSQAIEHELAEVQRKNERLTLLRTELLTINSADKDQRERLETQRAQLEKDRQAYAENLRRVENELTVVEQRIKNADEEKRRKVDDLYRNFKSQGLLAITN